MIGREINLMRYRLVYYTGSRVSEKIEKSSTVKLETAGPSQKRTPIHWQFFPKSSHLSTESSFPKAQPIHWEFFPKSSHLSTESSFPRAHTYPPNYTAANQNSSVSQTKKNLTDPRNCCIGSIYTKVHAGQYRTTPLYTTLVVTEILGVFHRLTLKTSTFRRMHYPINLRNRSLLSKQCIFFCYQCLYRRPDNGSWLSRNT